MNFFDIIIIGAGPAGLQCAKFLGNSKFRVLLLEKNKEIGPKVCAGGLTFKDIEYLKLPESLLDFFYRKVNIYVNNNLFLLKHKNNLIYTIDRKTLGQWQLEKLKKYHNIKIKTESFVSEIEKKYIIVNNEKIYYNYLIGADGSNSIIKNYLNLKSEDIGMAIQYLITNHDYKDIELYLNSKLFSSSYAWIFPHKNYISVGCGSKYNIIPTKKLKENLEKFLNKKKIDFSNSKFEAFTINYDYQGFKFDNIFLIGDAAGLASGLTGEGIYQALISGEEVAKKIIDPNYNCKKIDDLLKIKKRHNLVLEILIKYKRFRAILFYLGVLMLKIPCLKKKMLKSMA